MKSDAVKRRDEIKDQSQSRACLAVNKRLQGEVRYPRIGQDASRTFTDLFVNSICSWQMINGTGTATVGSK